MCLLICIEESVEELPDLETVDDGRWPVYRLVVMEPRLDRVTYRYVYYNTSKIKMCALNHGFSRSVRVKNVYINYQISPLKMSCVCCLVISPNLEHRARLIQASLFPTSWVVELLLVSTRRVEDPRYTVRDRVA